MRENRTKFVGYKTMEEIKTLIEEKFPEWNDQDKFEDYEWELFGMLRELEKAGLLKVYTP